MNTRATRLFLAVCVLVGVAGGALWATKPWQPSVLVTALAAMPVEGVDGDLRLLLKISNPGAPDRLLSASSPRGSDIRIDPPRLDGIPIPGETDLSLALDSAHFIITGVETKPGPGELFPVTLFFESAGQVHLKARMAEPVQAGMAMEVGLFGLGDICRVEEGEPAPAIDLNVIQQAAGGYRISLKAEQFEFTEHLVDGPHIPGTGHGHLYVGGAKVQRLYAPEAMIGALPSGRHEIRVTLNTNDHRAYVIGEEPVVAISFVTVPES